MCGSLFWGFLLILIGVVIIINILLGLNIPIFKIFFAALFIYFGITLLMPDKCKSWRKSYYRCYSNYSRSSIDQTDSANGEDYKACFTSATINLNSWANINYSKTIRISAQFSDLKVDLPEGLPVRVKASPSFSTIVLPNGENNVEYTNLYGAGEPILTVYIDAVFSNVIVRG